MDRDFTEDELKSFEGWARYQSFDTAKASPRELAALRGAFEDVMRVREARRPMGRMKLHALRPGEFRYAVGVRVGEGLWFVSLRTVKWSRHSRRIEPITRSAKGFWQGALGAVITCRISMVLMHWAKAIR